MAFLPAHAKRRIEHYTTATTSTILGGNYVGGVTRDSAGNHWFASRGAVSRFDGTSWKIFTPADGVPESDPFEIATDPLGRVWVGYGDAGAYFDGTRFRKLKWADDRLVADIRAIAFEGDRVAWVGGMGVGTSLWRCVDTVCAVFSRDEGLNASAVVGMAIDRDGNKWIGTYQSGLWKYNDTTFTRCDSAQLGETMWRFSSVAVDARGTLWVGGPAGLRKREEGVWSKVDLGRTGWTASGVTRIIATPDSSVYVQQENAPDWIIRLNDTALTTREVGRLFTVDPDGTLWTAPLGFTTGVVSWRGSTKTLYQADGLGDDDVRAMVADRQGRHWFATDGGVARLDGDGWKSYGFAQGLPTGTRSITEDSQGRIWLQDDNWNVFRDTVNGFVHDSRVGASILSWRHDGTSSRVTHGNGVYARASGVVSWSSLVYLSSRVYASGVDRQGREWFATEGGLLGYDSGLAAPKGSARMHVDSSISSTRWPLHDLAVDSTSGLWVVSQYGRLSHFDQGVWTYPLPDVTVQDILVDRNGDLWVSGSWKNKDDNTYTYRVRHHGRNDTTDYMGSTKYLAVDAGNDIWLMGGAGLSRLVAEEPSTSGRRPSPRIARAACLDQGCRHLAVGASGDLDIIDLRGSIVLSTRLSGGVADISRLPRGVYQLRLRSASGITTQRFLKP